MNKTPKIKLSWRERLAKKFFAAWPKRRVRPVCRFALTNDMKLKPRCINSLLRQRGYTSGDRIVVLLESDFEHIANRAHKKSNGPLLEMFAYLSSADNMRKMLSTNSN